jgi:hypothetical protein
MLRNCLVLRCYITNILSIPEVFTGAQKGMGVCQEIVTVNVMRILHVNILYSACGRGKLEKLGRIIESGRFTMDNIFYSANLDC